MGSAVDGAALRCALFYQRGEATVKKHTTHIFEKPDARNRTQAVARARDLGILASD